MEQRRSSAFVEGEDSESDEEINTEHMTEKSPLDRPADPRAAGHVRGVVAGEGSETDEEDSRVAASEQTDGVGASLRVPGGGPRGSRSGGSTPRSSRRSSDDSSSAFPPPSLLHKKLRERNTSLRRNIVERILRIYHATCRNLTIVNDNLSRNQATIEKVNAHLKKAGQDLEKINITMEMASEALCEIAPTLRMDVPLGRSLATTVPPDSGPPAPPSKKMEGTSS